MSEQWLMILSRLAVGAVATFFAIILWSKTRDVAWMFVVIGTIVSYGETVLSALEAFGVVRVEALVVEGVSVIRLVVANLPMIFFIVAFGVMLARKRIG